MALLRALMGSIALALHLDDHRVREEAVEDGGRRRHVGVRDDFRNWFVLSAA
jgi:hypothetical protein